MNRSRDSDIFSWQNNKNKNKCLRIRRNCYLHISNIILKKYITYISLKFILKNFIFANLS